MSKKFKHGVSNWTLVFDNQEVYLNTVRSEIVKYFCNNTIEIIINEASIPNELVHLFKQGNTVLEVLQEYTYSDGSNDDLIDTWVYDNLKIRTLLIISNCNGYSTFKIVLSND